MNLAENLECKEKPIEIFTHFYVKSILLSNLITPTTSGNLIQLKIAEFYSYDFLKKIP